MLYINKRVGIIILAFILSVTIAIYFATSPKDEITCFTPVTNKVIIIDPRPWSTGSWHYFKKWYG